MPNIIFNNFQENTAYFDGTARCWVEDHKLQYSFSDINTFLSKDDYENFNINKKTKTMSNLINVPINKIILCADVWLPEDNYRKELVDKVTTLTKCITNSKNNYVNDKSSEYFIWATNVKYIYDYICCSGDYACSGRFKEKITIPALFITNTNTPPEIDYITYDGNGLDFTIEYKKWKLYNANNNDESDDESDDE